MTRWNLASTDSQVILTVDEDDSNGAMSGTLQAHGTTFQVKGAWSASGSVPGRNASAFAISGNDGLAAPTWVSASGIMVGPGAAPQSIEIQIDVATPAGALIPYQAELLPHA